jgi:hypothetical protein
MESRKLYPLLTDYYFRMRVNATIVAVVALAIIIAMI